MGEGGRVAAADPPGLAAAVEGEGDEVDSDAMAMFRQLALRSAIATLGQLAEEGAVSVTSPRIRTITFRRPS